MNCVFQRYEDRYKCGGCGFEIKIDIPPEKIYRECIQVKQEFPSVVEQAKNFVGAAVKHAADGFQNVSQDEADRRLSICQKCPHYFQERCLLCGCNMPTKIHWNTSSCPDGRW